MGLPETTQSSHEKATTVEPNLDRWPGKKVLFVCSVNHGRSQMAEAIFRAIFPDVEVTSAGSMNRTDEYDDNKPNPIVVQILKENNLETNNLIVKHLKVEDVDKDTDVVTFIRPDLIPNEIIDHARSVIYIPIDDPSVSVFIWGEKPPIDKDKIAESFKRMQDLIQNRLRNIMLDVRKLEQELKERNIHYPVSNIYSVSGQTVSRFPRWSYEQ